ncbi:subunit of Snf5 [Mitosporidium daphniae]|uniref:Subunit of Snf5 n=1 Tax=Mitosporidium daphniae TaxID=1485682 RepID=A0A098VUG3_9MICR|nr:subunit of Snf5 [Mitosporidium daphniae]KGG52595.1 subunit of Snf5 [Mitosporidium daphniae]|eukprot:XP_013239031.1 subunit of Snf5 [Mitosporidium daphniae]
MEDFSRFNVILQGPPLMLLIKLDIIAVGYNLIDQFEWQLNPECESYKNSPENYATKFVAEMSLNTEFISAIAHSIREQCHWARKALVNQGYDWNIDERSQIPYELMGLLSVNPKPLELRPEQEWDLYSPKVTKVDESASSIFHPSAQERESRRLRRQMRSKGMLGLGSSLGIFGMDSSWPLSFKKGTKECTKVLGFSKQPKIHEKVHIGEKKVHKAS